MMVIRMILILTMVMIPILLIMRWEIASIAPLVPLLAFITALFVPESPVYLVTIIIITIPLLLLNTIIVNN